MESRKKHRVVMPRACNCPEIVLKPRSTCVVQIKPIVVINASPKSNE
jgi:hypothetical protein